MPCSFLSYISIVYNITSQHTATHTHILHLILFFLTQLQLDDASLYIYIFYNTLFPSMGNCWLLQLMLEHRLWHRSFAIVIIETNHAELADALVSWAEAATQTWWSSRCLEKNKKQKKTRTLLLFLMTVVYIFYILHKRCCAVLLPRLPLYK